VQMGFIQVGCLCSKGTIIFFAFMSKQSIQTL
jgi:hypothetical protein